MTGKRLTPPRFRKSPPPGTAACVFTMLEALALRDAIVVAERERGRPTREHAALRSAYARLGVALRDAELELEAQRSQLAELERIRNGGHPRHD